MRKVINLTFFTTIILLTLFASINCQKSRYEYFIVHVDSLYASSPISYNDTLKIHLYGFIGSDGCYSFSHFEAERDSFRLNLAVWGKHDVKAVICPLGAVPLDTIYQVYPLYPGLFNIEIEQPDGSVLKDTVTVE